MEKGGKTKFELAVCEKVTLFRKEKGISQYDLSVILDVSRGFIGQVESKNNRSTYNLNHLNRLAFEYGCSPKDFLPDAPLKEASWD